mgnify:CR=1 FL=1
MMKEMIRKVMEWCKLWNGETATAKQAGPSSDKREKEQAADNREVQDRLENYLWKHYEFRFNVLTEQPEYCAKGQGTDTPYKIVTQRTLNTLCLEAHRHRINCWDKDVSRLLHSERLEDYHPFLTYMDTLPQWDGVDRITPLAQRISKKTFWINGFHRWMLGMAAQWSGRMDRCANAVAPMLVSRMQGKCKSTFCQLLMPDGLRDYYTDSFELTGQSGCEQKLAQFGLINLDEYDRLSPQKLPLLKTLMQMKKLDFRKSHRSSYSHLPRMASFIGTSNHKDLLTDRPPLSLCRGERENRLHATGAQAIVCPIEGGAGRRRALLVFGRRGSGTAIAQPRVLCHARRAGGVLPLLPSARGRRGVQTLFGFGHFHHFAEPLSCRYARHDGGAFRQDDERYGGGTDAYGERKSVQGGAGGIIPVHQAG